MKCILLAAASVLTVTALHAQIPATLTGRVERLTAAACDPTATHKVTCTDVLLKSSVVDLTTVEGRVMVLSGDVALQIGCPTIDVATATAATEQTIQFSFGGFRIGRTVTITTLSPIGSLLVYLWAGGPGFLPFGQFGSYLLDPAQTIFDQIVPSIGLTVRTETIPNDPSLVGAVIHYQTGYASIATGISFGMLNANCFTIRQ